MARGNGDQLQSSFFGDSIYKMSEGYYSRDKPNPNLQAFVESHVKDHPFVTKSDDYSVPAFGKPIEATKVTAIYNMHRYWSKKPHDAIRQYIRHYTKPDDLVLDPFCGSGGTALAGLMEGRQVIAIDRSPAATFITKNYCTPVDVEHLHKSFEAIKEQVKPELDWLYETRCDRCGGKARTVFTVYSQVFRCGRCFERIPLFDCIELNGKTAADKSKKISVCPRCYSRGITEEISTRSERLGAIPVLISYVCEGKCNPARAQRRHDDQDEKKREYFEKYDLGKILEIESKDIPHWYPTDRMMNAPEDRERWGVKWRSGTSNFRTVDELYTKRNLWALSAWFSAANNAADDRIRFAVSSLSLGLSRMCNYDPKWSFPYPLLAGTYYTPQTFKEMNAFEGIVSKVKLTLTRAWTGIAKEIRNTGGEVGRLLLSTQSCTDLSAIAANSLDYIFTDPPYADKVQYGELNFVWEAWLGFDTHWHEDEIIINEVRGKTEADWTDRMRKAMAECYRVLKPGRWLSLCYHDTSEGTWALIQDIMAETGFLADESDTATFIDTEQKSYNQLTADKVNKRDLVINFRKPKPGEISSAMTIDGDEDELTFAEKVCGIIRDYLNLHPGATKDRVYDEVVSKMVRAGKMEVHNFDSLLCQVAEEVREPVPKNLFENEQPNLFGTHEIGRWYLKETEVEVVDVAESAKEDAAARIVSNSISNWLRKHPEGEGVHYSDVFEHYIYAVKDKPRRQLQDWLLDYFYKTQDGTYRLPANEDEVEAKARGRTSGTNHRVKRYVAFIEQGVAVPEKERATDATLAEWIRVCKRSGLYEQGKLLYERGGLKTDNLSEEAQVSVEEDYEICVRLLSRSDNGKQGKKGPERKGDQERLFQ
ncbi:MAG: hypothetical protein M1358_15160 [Chloroflexi bacterium]|nr:hypothetical protein [Chloroflexota bacterium]